jgi:hypothetical protein
MCVGNAVLHCGHTESCFGFFASCARRLPVRALLCLRFGTAISGHLQPTPEKPQILNHRGSPVNVAGGQTGGGAVVPFGHGTSRVQKNPP